MTHTLESLLGALASCGWRVQSLRERRRLPEQILARYPWMPDEFRDLAEQMECICSPDDKTWMLTVSDFLGRGDSAFAWNEWERQSLDAAASDAVWADGIRSFWDLHLPIMMSVKSAYSFCAIERPSSLVVFGEEPEYEDVVPIAPSLDALLTMMARHDPRLSRFL